MATTITEIERFLYEREVRYEKKSDAVLVLGFKTHKFVNPAGTKSLALVVELDENGGYFSLFAPQAFSLAKPEHQGAFMVTCGLVMYAAKLIQFEFDPKDGEVRPKIEFPLEDSALTQKQFNRCLEGLVQILEEYYEPLHKAATEGIIPDAVGPAAALSSLLDRMLANLPQGMRDDLARRLREGGQPDGGEA